jgi:FAD/FMN-containing dehydrogenase
MEDCLMVTATDTAASHPLIAELKQIIGDEFVITDAEELAFYSTDVHNQLETPLCVVQPGTAEELSRLVVAATTRDIAIVPRGGGVSYTDGYCIKRPNSILIDTLRLNKILEVNEQDMYVTVEAGVTWKALNVELEKRGLRTPFWGPFSGLKASVGGSASQNSASLGSAQYGITADNLLALEVVLADGKILHTGSLAANNGTPFFRHYGPDLTGLFAGDCGALGVKTKITMPLIKRPKALLTVSFGFKTFEAMSMAMAAVAREGVCDTNFGMDTALQTGQMDKTNTRQMMAAAWAVFKTSRNIFDGTVQLLKMALAGKSFLNNLNFTAHFIVEDIDLRVVKNKLAVVRKAVLPYGGEIPNTVASVLRADPFIDFYTVLGAKGERWNPQHGVIPFSKMQEFRKKLETFFAANADEITRRGIITGAMFLTIKTHAFLYEPVFWWPDEQTIVHKRLVPKDLLKRLPVHEAAPETKAFVDYMKKEINQLFASVGAIHFQIGKTYPYLEGRQAESTKLLKQLKQDLDPKGLMNPGALGLNTEA